VLRVIARLNLGGPAYHVSVLSSRLDPERYETVLVAGRVGRDEESLTDLAERSGVHLTQLEALAPEIHPRADARAFVQLRRIMTSFRPDIVHTHTAKAGMLGRSAAAISRPRPVIVHTFHGHVLEGYFGPAQNAFYRGLERGLARVSDCLIGVSNQTVDDLVRLRIAPRHRFRVIPLGLNLAPFLGIEEGTRGDEFRQEIGVDADEVLVGYVGRLEPIKRLDVALRAVAHGIELGAPLVLAVVGGGSRLEQLRRLAGDLGIADRVRFVGFRRDLERILSGIDIALLTSDNEGTPVFLIEAAAAGRPAVATSVGGVPEIVVPETGELASPGDHRRLGELLAHLSADSELRRQMGAAARMRVRERFASDRLVGDIDALYAELLARRGHG
jgi:glycosyltransferase involved in cell wall biosynthesis